MASGARGPVSPSIAGVKLLQEFLCDHEIVRIVTFGKAIMDGSQKRERFAGSPLVFPQPRQARRRSQFPRDRLLPARPFERSMIVGLGLAWPVGCAIRQDQ